MMTAQTAAEWLIQGTAPAVTAFTLWYGLTVRWWKFWIGRALVVSSTAFALLIDLSVLNLWFDWIIPPWAGVAVLFLVFVGAWLKFISLAIEKRRSHQRLRA